MWKCENCGREFTKTDQHHFCGKSPTTIDEYIEAQKYEVRAILTKVRETIRKEAPDAIEKISWQMPTYWQGENLIHFAAFKKHIGIYPGDLTLTPFIDRLEGYHFTKGAIQFPLDKPIDYNFIAEIARYRVEKVTGAKSKQSK